MKIRECMCNESIFVNPNTTVQDVAKQMKDNHIGCVPVCDENQKLVGLVTDRDVVLRCIACDKDAKTVPVSEIMTTQVHTAGPDDDIEHATEKMCDCNVRRIPIVENGCLKGMLTISDLSVSPLCPTETVGYVVEEICGCHSRNRNAE